jgi:hypothetical protein
LTISLLDDMLYFTVFRESITGFTPAVVADIFLCIDIKGYSFGFYPC